jgi:hypothetical protein
MKLTQTTTLDPIVQEVRDAKELLAARFDFDVARMLRDAQKRQGAAVRGIVSVPRRKSHADTSKNAARPGLRRPN